MANLLNCRCSGIMIRSSFRPIFRLGALLLAMALLPSSSSLNPFSSGSCSDFTLVELDEVVRFIADKPPSAKGVKACRGID